MQRQEGLWIHGVNVTVPQRRVFCVYATKLASDESLGRQYMRAVYHQWSSQIASTSESYGGDSIIPRYDRSSWRVGLLQCSHSLKGARQVKGQSRVVERGEKATTSPVGLSYPKVKHRLERRWTRRSTIVPQRRIYRSRRKGYRCKLMDSRDMGLAAPWCCRGGTSVESLIPCFYGGRALVVKRGPRRERERGVRGCGGEKRGKEDKRWALCSTTGPLTTLTISANYARPIHLRNLLNLRLLHIVQLITRLSHHQIKVTMLSLFRPKRAASDHLTPEHSCKQPRYAYADEADVF
ncbi:hypothetical protein BHM03_00014546 [Ensete ventricosum]|nr:hypothetical protein BHM03_00014546 [Ensete ventricosum]